jgi:hypothetical protein
MRPTEDKARLKMIERDDVEKKRRRVEERGGK